MMRPLSFFGKYFDRELLEMVSVVDREMKSKPDEIK